MGWVDQVPRAGNLYIGGLYALYQTSLVQAAGITHVLSVINYDAQLLSKFPHLKHLHIEAEDDPNENLLKEFTRTCKYIEDGLRSENGKQGGVFVHCAMGKSRSATLVVAYLMWKYNVTWENGLEWLCEGRPICDPNLGFKEQLGIWERMLNAASEEDRHTIYKTWLKERFTGDWWEWENKMIKTGRNEPALKAQL